MSSNEIKSSQKDLISIILPCYNASLYLEKSLRSLLNQTYSYFELITIDDGSQDETLDILNNYKKSDSRIIVSMNASNLGIPKTLNKGIQMANGKYIARMDADDIASPYRLEKQLNYLHKNLDIDFLGTSINLINDAGHFILKQPFSASSSTSCHFISYFTSPIIHSTLIGKAKIFKDALYSESKDHLHIEDFELFQRLIAKGYKLSNLHEPLLSSRHHRHSTSRRNASIQTKNAIHVIQKRLKSDLLINLTNEEAGLFRYQPASYLSNRLRQLSKNFRMIKDKFFQIHRIPPKSEKEINSFIAYILAESFLKQISHREYWKLNNSSRNLSDLMDTGVLSGSIPYIIRRINGHIVHFLKSETSRKVDNPSDN